MRPPAKIKDWLTTEQMQQWLDDAPDAESRNRRMAIWLTYAERLHAPMVADRLGVSVQAVWLWIRQYNEHGPDGLLRQGRGGRRRATMTPDQETQVLAPFIAEAHAGRAPKPQQIKTVIEQHLKRQVSMSYVYRLLQRHRWADILAQSHRPKRRRKGPDTFERFTRPWRRNP